MKRRRTTPGSECSKTETAAARRKPAVRASAAPIFYSVTPCPLGCLLVAATDQGLCAVRFDDSREALFQGLADDFPRASLTEDAVRSTIYVEPLLRFLDGDANVNLSEFSLDLEATDFQWKVWKQLMALPVGETITYGDLARRLGDIKAVRAVAHANAKNPVAVVIPCHRVVGSDGSLTGYRWGLERKRQLLVIESGMRKPEGRLF